VTDIRENNTYHFEVDRRANKNQIREAVETLFPDVTVVSIRTMRTPGKQRRYGWVRGRTPEQKKAVIELQAGDTIDIGY
jgi:large subunit ribosomal protein L23